MRRHVFVRPARAEEAPEFIEWSIANRAQNGFDAEVARFPTTIVLAAYDKSGVLAYMPLQSPFFMEGIALRPGLEKKDVAACLKEFTQAAVTLAHTKGVGEIYFLGTEDGTDAMATNHVFEKLPYSVYRLKVKDTER